MKIMHMMLSCFYIDGWGYQENILPYQNKIDGHDVKIIASTETYINPNQLGYVKPSIYINEYGVEVHRVPYKKIYPKFLAKKIRSYSGVNKILEDFKPDVIFHHGCSAFELLNVVEYVRKNPYVKLFLDHHADYDNTARSYFSKNILHKQFYRRVLKKTIPSVSKIFYISMDCGDFLKEIYEVPMEIMEFFPLGGFIIDGQERLEKRKAFRKAHNVQEEDVCMFHTGKLQPQKRTLELLKAFVQVPDEKLRLFIIGNIPIENQEEINMLLNRDARIKYLGWMNRQGLLDCLCASDLYLQPGVQSATMQIAICCGSPVMLYPYKSHEPFVKENGFFINSVEDMVEVFKKISTDSKLLNNMSDKSFEIARQLLDYRKLAARLYV